MSNREVNSPRRDDLVELYGRVLKTRLSRELLRGAIAAVDSRLEDDIKREAAAEKGFAISKIINSKRNTHLLHFRTEGHHKTKTTDKNYFFNYFGNNSEKDADAAEREHGDEAKRIEEELALLEASGSERRIRQERELERRRADLKITENEAGDALARFREQASGFIILMHLVRIL